MDQDLAALVFKTATTVVGLIWADARELAKSGLRDRWRQSQPDHMRAAEADLAEARAQLPAACGAGDNQVEQNLVPGRPCRSQRPVSPAPQAVAAVTRP